MNRILLVDLGERELKKRQELRARRQVLKTIDSTANTSGGLSSSQMAELESIQSQLSSDITVDPFYRLVVATHQQKKWPELERTRDFAHEYGSPKCLVKIGCWCPVVNCNVTKRGWMARASRRARLRWAGRTCPSR